MVTLGRILSITVIVLAILAASILIYSELVVTNSSYNSSIKVSFERSPAAYDYSCGESDYQLLIEIKNTGAENITGLSVSVTNPLCVDAIPTLPTTLNASAALSFYVQSAAQNGTITISGSNTLILVKF